MKRVPDSIVVVGSINTDLVVTSTRLPAPGETVPGTRFATYGGGKGANQAVAAARLGARVQMIGKLGSDGFGADARANLEAEGIDCSYVETTDGASGVALITVDERGANTIVVVPGANAAVTPAFVESKRDTLRQAGIVLAQLEVPLEAVLHLARLCSEEGVPLMLDPAPACRLPEELFSLCTWFTPNETEAAFYAGLPATAEPAEVVAALRSQSARNLLLKRGGQGAFIDAIDAPPFEAPAYRVTAVDTTAAGDTYNGAFAAGLVRGESLPSCSRSAAAAAALSVTRHGAQTSMPGLDEVQGFLHAHDGSRR